MEALISFCFIFAIIFAIFILNLFILRLKAMKYKANISFSQIIGMTLKKIPPKIIVDAQILCCKAGIPVETNLFEAHYLAGGNVHRVVQALIEAQKANTKLDFKEAAATDLALAIIEEKQICIIMYQTLFIQKIHLHFNWLLIIVILSYLFLRKEESMAI